MALLLVAAGLMVFPPSVAHAASTITNTYSYTGATQTFTVPAGVTSITVTLKGGEGGRGGHDSQGTPQTGGYQGMVTGTVAVTPGQVITVAVGGGGGIGTSSQGSAPGGSAGLNPLSGYDGAVGGIAGPAGSSGGGGGSGAASVLVVGSSHIVAGGAGGNGGSGQYTPIVGRRAEETHTARPDATSTDGRPGLNTSLACSPGFNCDGGASGAGGGGAQGGERGNVQYGGASATEYFGFGGWPGSNSTAGLAGLAASYSFYSGNGGNGSITITYDDGAPSAPLNLVGTTRNGGVGLTWNAPANPGSAAISDYRVEYGTNSNGPWTIVNDGTSTTTSAEVTGLTNGVGYYFRVTAINSVGLGAPASTSVSVVPSDVPARPTVTAVTGFGGGIYVDFTPGSSNSPITGYEYRLDGGDWTAAAAASNRLTIAGLTNGQTYAVEIRALNIIGASLASTPAASGTPRDVPSAPTNVLATAGDASIALTWTAPSLDNGAAITDYKIERATVSTGPFTIVNDGVSTATAANITGLANGTTYFVRVSATNAAGTGPVSVSAIATPFTTPSAPAISLSPGDGSLTVTVTPGSNGGSAVTAYEYRIGTGPWINTGTLGSQFTINGLTNGTSYDVSVRATNAAGNSSASNVATASPRTVPAAPAISAVALDDGAVSVSFVLGSDGGSALTNIQYSIDGGANWLTRSPVAVTSPLTINGLTGGVTYPIRLRVLNAAGTSAASNVSSVTAKGTPDSPSISVTPGDRMLTVSFVAPANGGSPITGYEYSVANGSWVPGSPAITSSPFSITGLSNGTSYSVRVRAVNAAGNSAASDAVAGTPRTVPGAPTIDDETIVGDDGTLDVAFTAPASDGGSAITTYQYSTDAGATWRDRDSGATASPLHITVESDGATPLVGGQTYPVEIRAVNAAGAGVASAVAAGITTTAPLAPTIDGVEGGNSSAVVHFTPAANGGSAIIRYEYRLDGGSWVDTGTLASEFTITGLTNSTSYSLELRAVNAVGNGAVSEPHAVDVFTRPGAPTFGTVVAGDRSLTVGFVAPSFDGGSEITGYQYSTDGGLTWHDRQTGTTESPLVIADESGIGHEALTNGLTYAVQLRAVNAAGAGAASETRLLAPRGAPAAPTALAVSGGNQSLVVSFTAADDGGSAITRYEYQLDGGSWIDAGSLSSPFTITGLSNGTEYLVAVRAVNGVGAGAASASVDGTPRTVPGAPTGVTTSSNSHEVTVNWTAPVSNGGSPLTGYTARVFTQASGGSSAASCTTTTALSCTITGLTNGTTYYAEVVATNAAGAGAASQPRSPQTPLAPPEVTIASITSGATSLSIAVNVVDGGGAPIVAYQYQLDGGDWEPAGSATSPFTISGLTTGTQYSVKIRAISTGGTGNASPAVNGTPYTTAGAPTALVATSGAASAALSWTAPASNGGKPITDYVVQYATSSNGTYTTFNDGVSTSTSATVTGLTNGTLYYFRVAAVNAAGNGSNSSLASTTPLAAPGAPTIGTITSGSTYLSVAFTAPSSNGGSAITGYQYRLDSGAWQNATGTTSPISINALTNGTTYAVQLRAVNAVGGGDASNTVSAKPYGIPAGVIGFRATPGNTTVTLDWDAVNDNGSPITAYNIIRWSAATEGSIAATYTTTSTTYPLTGLTNGTSYYFTIEATNAAGTGARSARISVTPNATAPAAPTSVTVTVNDAAASMTWVAGAAGTSAITSYIVQYSTDGTVWTTRATPTSAAASFDLPSTTTPYQLRVAGVSASGAGAFTTTRPPLATTGVVSNLASSSATVNAAANASVGTGTVAVEFATSSAALGGASDVSVAATPASVSGNAVTAVTAALSGLTPNTTYFARVVVTANGHTTYGAVRSFTTNASIETSGLSPTYTGSPVTLSTVTVPSGLALTRTFVGINGTVYPSSSTPPTDVGTYQVTTTPTNTSIGGQEVVTLTIEAKQVTVSVDAIDRPYDGTTTVQIDHELSGVVAGDDVELGGVFGAFRDPDAGVDKTVDLEWEVPLLRGADAGNYALSGVAATTTGTIEQTTQTLTFTSTAPTSAIVGDTYVPVAESSAGLTPVLSIDAGSSSVCSISGSVVTLLAAGDCVIAADQAGTVNVGAAATVTQTVDVYLEQVIELPDVDDLTIAEGPVELPSETGDGLPLTYTAGPAEVCSVSGSTVTLLAAGTCEVTAHQAGDATRAPAEATVDFEVERNDQTIELPDVDDLTIAEGPVELPSETDDGLPLTYTAGPAEVCSVSGTTVTLLGAGTCHVTANQAGDATRAPAEATVDFEVARNAQTLALAELADLEIGEGPVELPSQTDDGLPLTYTAGPAEVCSVSGTTVTLLGAGTCHVTANQAGDTTTMPAQDDLYFQVFRDTQDDLDLDLDAFDDVNTGDGPIALPAETPSGLPLTYTAGPADVCTVDGTTLTIHGLGTCTVTADQAGDATHAPASVSTSFTVTAPPPVTAESTMNLTLDLDPGQAVAGATVVVRADGLKPNSVVRIEMHSEQVLLATVTTDANGSLVATVQLPAGIDPGEHQIVAVGIAPDEQQVTASMGMFVDWSGALAVSGTAGGYTPITATRILDTREEGDALAASTERSVVVGAGLVPADVTAVVVNLTVTEGTGPGFVTVYPCDGEPPLAAAINFTTDETKANLVDVRFAAGDELCLWSNVDVHVVIDLQGYHSESGTARLVPQGAVRLVDTRSGTAVGTGETLEVDVIGAGKAPDGSTTVALNVAAVGPAAPGFLTVFPCGIERPLASNLNFVGGQVVSNEVLVAPSDDGTVCIYSTQATDLVVDLNAAYHLDGEMTFSAVVPGRLADTRDGAQPADGDTVVVAVAEGAVGVTLNVAVTDPTVAGFLTVFACGTERPLASNLNFAAGQTISNHVTVMVGDSDSVCVYTSAAAHVVVDIEGVYRRS